MQRVILLHSNDIHGRVDGLARLSTLVRETRTHAHDTPVVYLDLGDIEETSYRLSNLTKGVAMHRLLRLLGCAAGAVGNGGLLRYGPDQLAVYAEAGGYPLLLANLRDRDGNLPPGVQPTLLHSTGTLHIGMIGVTAPLNDAYALFGLYPIDTVETVRACAAALRQDGADIIIVLSHLGLADDRLLAEQTQNDVDIILGAHSHDLLPNGEWNGRVLIAQAGSYAEYLGRIDLGWDGEQLVVEQATTLAIDERVLADGVITQARQHLEAEAEQFLSEVIGELASPLDYAIDRECGVANLLADALRERMAADVGLISAGQAFTRSLPAGPLQRLTLWDACESSANPAVATMSGAQLLDIVMRGTNPAFAAERPRPLRGAARGMLHLSGATLREGRLFVGETPIDERRDYRVAASDWELEPYGGYARAEWALEPRFDVPTLLREALEDYLATHCPASTSTGRLG